MPLVGQILHFGFILLQNACPRMNIYILASAARIIPAAQ